MLEKTNPIIKDKQKPKGNIIPKRDTTKLAEALKQNLSRRKHKQKSTDLSVEEALLD